MAVRLRYRIEASVSSSSAEEKDLGNMVREVVHDLSGEGGSRKTTLAAGATDVSVMMNEIADAKFVLVKINAKDPTQTLTGIEIKKNAVGGEVINIEPLGANGVEGHLLMSTTGITDLFASNPGTIDIDVTVIMVGD